MAEPPKLICRYGNRPDDGHPAYRGDAAYRCSYCSFCVCCGCYAEAQENIRKKQSTSTAQPSLFLDQRSGSSSSSNNATTSNNNNNNKHCWVMMPLPGWEEVTSCPQCSHKPGSLELLISPPFPWICETWRGEPFRNSRWGTKAQSGGAFHNSAVAKYRQVREEYGRRRKTETSGRIPRISACFLGTVFGSAVPRQLLLEATTAPDEDNSGDNSSNNKNISSKNKNNSKNNAAAEDDRDFFHVPQVAKTSSASSATATTEELLMRMATASSASSSGSLSSAPTTTTVASGESKEEALDVDGAGAGAAASQSSSSSPKLLQLQDHFLSERRKRQQRNSDIIHNTAMASSSSGVCFSPSTAAAQQLQHEQEVEVKKQQLATSYILNPVNLGRIIDNSQDNSLAATRREREHDEWQHDVPFISSVPHVRAPYFCVRGINSDLCIKSATASRIHSVSRGACCSEGSAFAYFLHNMDGLETELFWFGIRDRADGTVPPCREQLDDAVPVARVVAAPSALASVRPQILQIPRQSGFCELRLMQGLRRVVSRHSDFQNKIKDRGDHTINDAHHHHRKNNSDNFDEFLGGDGGSSSSDDDDEERGRMVYDTQPLLVVTILVDANSYSCDALQEEEEEEARLRDKNNDDDGESCSNGDDDAASATTGGASAVGTRHERAAVSSAVDMLLNGCNVALWGLGSKRHLLGLIARAEQLSNFALHVVDGTNFKDAGGNSAKMLERGVLPQHLDALAANMERFDADWFRSLSRREARIGRARGKRLNRLVKSTGSGGGGGGGGGVASAGWPQTIYVTNSLSNITVSVGSQEFQRAQKKAVATTAMATTTTATYPHPSVGSVGSGGGGNGGDIAGRGVTADVGGREHFLLATPLAERRDGSGGGGGGGVSSLLQNNFQQQPAAGSNNNTATAAAGALLGRTPQCSHPLLSTPMVDVRQRQQQQQQQQQQEQQHQPAAAALAPPQSSSSSASLGSPLMFKVPEAPDGSTNDNQSGSNRSTNNNSNLFGVVPGTSVSSASSSALLIPQLQQQQQQQQTADGDRKTNASTIGAPPHQQQHLLLNQDASSLFPATTTTECVVESESITDLLQYNPKSVQLYSAALPSSLQRGGGGKNSSSRATASSSNQNNQQQLHQHTSTFFAGVTLPQFDANMGKIGIGSLRDETVRKIFGSTTASSSAIINNAYPSSSASSSSSRSSKQQQQQQKQKKHEHHRTSLSLFADDVSVASEMVTASMFTRQQAAGAHSRNNNNFHHGNAASSHHHHHHQTNNNSNNSALRHLVVFFNIDWIPALLLNRAAELLSARAGRVVALSCFDDAQFLRRAEASFASSFRFQLIEVHSMMPYITEGAVLSHSFAKLVDAAMGDRMDNDNFDGDGENASADQQQRNNAEDGGGAAAEVNTKQQRATKNAISAVPSRIRGAIERALASFPEQYRPIISHLAKHQIEVGVDVFVGVNRLADVLEGLGHVITAQRLRQVILELSSNQIAKYEESSHSLRILYPELLLHLTTSSSGSSSGGGSSTGGLKQ